MRFPLVTNEIAIPDEDGSRKAVEVHIRYVLGTRLVPKELEDITDGNPCFGMLNNRWPMISEHHMWV